jgi:hypothetical protein
MRLESEAHLTLVQRLAKPDLESRHNVEACY